MEISWSSKPTEKNTVHLCINYNIKLYNKIMQSCCKLCNLRQPFTWSSISLSDRPTHFALLPFCPLTPGNTGALLLLFRVAAGEEVKETKVLREVFQQ